VVLARTGLPFVLMDIRSPELEARSSNFVMVRNSSEEIGREAARYLVGQGVARSYAFLHNRAVMEWGVGRFAAFKETLAGVGLWCEELYEPTEVARLKRPVAVLTANDDKAFELVEFLRSRRLRIPQDVAVLGINNDTLICENCRPRISSVQPDFEQEGFISAKALDEMIRGIDPGERTKLVGVKSIVKRESTAELSNAGRLVQKAVSFIDRHALEGIGVGDVVAHLKCSRRLADLRFRQLQGCSILQAITERRLDEVRRRLVETRDKTYAIADACGFNNSNYLKNLFKKRFGTSMSEFRRSAASV